MKENVDKGETEEDEESISKRNQWKFGKMKIKRSEEK